MDGWIKISRAIADHWIWEDAERLKWWLDLLIMAEWQPRKRLVRGRLIVVGRGQAVISLRFLQDRWAKRDADGNVISKPDRHTIIKWLRLLEQENMVNRVSQHHGMTLLTICNYERYQCDMSDTNTTNNTTNNTKHEELKNNKENNTTYYQRKSEGLKDGESRSVGQAASKERRDADFADHIRCKLQGGEGVP